MARVKKDINIIELQDTINDLEAEREFTSPTDLFKAVADSDWGKQYEVSFATIYSRVKEHNLKYNVKATRIRGLSGDSSEPAPEKKSPTRPADNSPTQPVERPERIPIDNTLRNVVRDLQNYCTNIDKNVGKLQADVINLRKEVRRSTNAKFERVYNKAVEDVTKALCKVIEDSNGDPTTLATILNPLNSQAHTNPLGHQFFESDGSVKHIAVPAPSGESFDF